LLLDSRLKLDVELEHVATLRAMAEEELDRALDEADQDRKYPRRSPAAVRPTWRDARRQNGPRRRPAEAS